MQFKTSEIILVYYGKCPMFSRMKAELDTLPFNTWGHSDIGDVFFLFESGEVQIPSVFIYTYSVFIYSACYFSFIVCFCLSNSIMRFKYTQLGVPLKTLMQEKL